LFNNLIILFIAASFVTSTCFYHLLFEGRAIQSSYDVTVCQLQEIIHFACRSVMGVQLCDVMEEISFDCTSLEAVEVGNSFDPPFYYSYQFSTTFLDNYVAVFVYAYLITAFGLPLLTYCMMRVCTYFGEEGRVSGVLQGLLPAYMHIVLATYNSGDIIFDQVGFVVSAVGDAVVLLTFGVVFPPLAVCICAGVVNRVCFVMVGIGRFLHKVEELHSAQTPKYRGALLRDCRGVAKAFVHLQYTVVLPFAAVFYSFLSSTRWVMRRDGWLLCGWPCRWPPAQCSSGRSSLCASMY
jgi:hypothetical protein